MVDITAWMEEFLRLLEERFGERVWFVGLQGSYGRGAVDFDPMSDALFLWARKWINRV